MKKGLYLTGFDGRQLSNGEKLQPSVSGVGEHTTVQGTTVVRSPSQNNTPIYQGYTNQRTYLGAVACLNLIANRAIPSFPTTDRSAPSTYVVVYPSAKGSVGNTMPQFPFTFHYKEWKIIVLVAKDYKDSAFLSSLLSRKQYLSAIEHLEAELKERYLSASLIPPEIIVSTNTIEQFFTEEITFQGTSGKIIIPSNSANAFTFFDGVQDALSFNSSASLLTSNYSLLVNGYLTVTVESTLASLTVSDIGANQLVFSENASGSLTGSGNLTFDGSTLALIGSATVSSDLTVLGVTNLNDDLTVTGDIDHIGNLNITGSITLNGQALTKTIDPSNAIFQDSLIILSDTDDGLTFNNSNDVGFMWEKASGSFTGLAWDYSENHFALFSTATEPSTGELTITQYADFKANDLSAVNATLSGNLTGVGATFSANLSAVNGTFSGNGSFNDLTVGGGYGTTGLTISDNGNVQTDGSILIGSTLDVTGVTNFNDTTSSTNSTSGAVIVDGGMGVAENLNIGGDFTATNATFSADISANNISATNSVLVGGGYGDVANGGLTLSDNGDLQTDGALTIDGVSTFGDNVTVNADLSASNLTTSGATTTDTLSVGGGFGDTGLSVSTDGNLQTDGSITSNTLTTVSDLTVGGDINLSGDLNSTNILISTLTDTHIVYGGNSGSLLGSASFTWTDGTSTLSTVNVSMTGNATIDGNTTLGNASTDTITANAEFNSSLVASATTNNLGSATKSWGTTFTNNLQINFGVNEQFSTITNASGSTTHDCSNGHIFYHNAPSADFDVVLTNLTLSQNYATTITLIIEQGATGRKPNTTVTLGGTTSNILWQGGAPPTPTSSAGSVDVFCLSILRTGASAYVILGQMIEDFS